MPADSDKTQRPAGALRRRDGLAHAVRLLATGVLSYHRVVVEGAQYLPRSGPALLLPKHRAYRDILLEGIVLYRQTGRYASYVMKTGLYGILGLLGGVKIVRPKDIRRLKDRQERRRHIEQARQRNQETMDYLAWLYCHGEVVISHPEGQRNKDVLGGLQKEVIEQLIQTEKDYGLRIPMIPIGLEYESFGRPRARAFMRVGEPLYTDQFGDVIELVQALAKRIALLSNIAGEAPNANES